LLGPPGLTFAKPVELLVPREQWRENQLTLVVGKRGANIDGPAIGSISRDWQRVTLDTRQFASGGKHVSVFLEKF